MDEKSERERKAPPDEKDLVAKCKRLDRAVEEAVKESLTEA
jgi:hypothetical protein